MKLEIDNLVYKYIQDCNDATSIFTNTELAKNLVNDLNSLFSLQDVVKSFYCDSKVCINSTGNLCNGWCKGVNELEPK